MSDIATHELIAELRDAAQLFRQHPVYNSEGDGVLLTVNADMNDKAADRIAVLTEALERRDAALRNARAWVFECWGWLMETDLDMTCPMQTDPLDIVEQIDAILGIDQALTGKDA